MSPIVATAEVDAAHDELRLASDCGAVATVALPNGADHDALRAHVANSVGRSVLQAATRLDDFMSLPIASRTAEGIRRTALHALRAVGAHDQGGQYGRPHRRLSRSSDHPGRR